jgi:glycosyltransferase involved in cell wall biosynthesis
VQQGKTLPVDPKRGSGPLISIVVPVYNVEAYLRECLDSIARQTLRDIEIICVNDFSPDNSQQILNEFGRNDRRFVLIRHKENKGLSGARNSGLGVARGDFVFFIDSDDLLATDDSLERLYVRSVEDDADEVVGGIVKWNQDTGEKYLDWHKYYLDEDVRGLPLLSIPQLCANVIACNKLIRMQLINDHCIRFNEEIVKNEDNPFSVKVHVLSKKISIVKETTYIYRQTSSSIMATERKNDAFSRWMYCHEVFKFIEEDNERQPFRKFYYPMYSGNMIASAGILARFFPSEKERSDLLQRWRKTIDILPDDFPEIPPRQRKIFAYIKQGEMDMAWKAALEYVESASKVRAQLIAELERLKTTSLALSAQVAAVYSSKSWRVTAPLRGLRRIVRGS